MEIQDRIRERRKALGLTLKDVAKALGVSEGTVSRYESADIQNMGVNKLTPLARVLQCSPVYLLLGGDENPEGTAASVSSIDSKKNWLNRLYDELEPKNKEALLTRADELYKLQQLEAGEKEIPRRSFSDSDAEGIA